MQELMTVSINQGRDDRASPFFGAEPQHFFRAGVRKRVQIESQCHMMDMYFGDGELGQTYGFKADPFIAAFINAALDPQNAGGPAANGLTPRPKIDPAHPLSVFDRRFNNAAAVMQRGAARINGWDQHPEHTAAFGTDRYGGTLTTTREISRIIRWCIGHFGGTLIFEGAEIYYNAVFAVGPTDRDTTLEARELFTAFERGNSRARLGAEGTLIFHWFGEETVPTKLHFLSSWQFNPRGVQEWSREFHPGNMAPGLANAHRAPGVLRQMPNNGPQVLVRNPLALRTSGRAFLDRLAGGPLLPIWNNFAPFPAGFTELTWRQDTVRFLRLN